VGIVLVIARASSGEMLGAVAAISIGHFMMSAAGLDTTVAYDWGGPSSLLWGEGSEILEAREGVLEGLVFLLIGSIAGV
jgi:hypothetical protein